MLIVNLALAFFLDLAALVALGVSGYDIAGGGAAGIALAIALPAAAALLWGLFAAPRAKYDVPALRVAVKVLVLGGSAVALAATGHVVLGAVLGAAVILNAAMLAVLQPSGASG